MQHYGLLLQAPSVFNCICNADKPSGNIANPVKELTASIKEIAAQNYAGCILKSMMSLENWQALLHHGTKA